MSIETDRLVARLRENPDDHAAYEALKEAYRASGDAASLVNLVEGWAGVCPDGTTACNAYLEAGQVAQETLADPVRAAALYRSAVHRDPYSGAALERAIQVLEQGERYEELVEFLTEYLGAMRGHPVDPSLLADSSVKLGRVLDEHYQDPARARAWYAEAMRWVPDHAEAIYLHRKLAEADGDVEALAQLYAAEAQAESDPARRLDSYGRLADLHIQQRASLDDGIAVLRQALSEVPGDVSTMHRLADCLLERAKGLPADQAERDHRRAGELLYQIGQGLSEDPGRALEYAQAALAAVPNHDGALDLAEDLAPRLGRTEVLPALWIAFVASAGPGPEVDRRRILLARAYANAGQLDDAIFCLEQMPESAEAAAILATLVGQRQQLAGDAAARTGADLDRPVGHERRARQPTPSEDRRAQDIARVDALRREVHQLITERRQDEAAARCQEIIALDPSDPEAFNFLENYHRKRRAFAELRDLLLTSTRVPGLSVDSRKLRLREVAVLSEGKLHDADAAIAAYQGVVTLDPADSEAVRSLKRLLEQNQRWEELVTVLEREAISSTDLEAKLALLEEIARVHRDHRQDPSEYAEATRQMYELRPSEAGRKALCDAYLALGQYEDVIPLVRAALERAADPDSGIEPAARLAQQRLLVRILDEELQDSEAAYVECQALLALQPDELSALDRMERIDEAGAYHERLLNTLTQRAALVDEAEQAALYERMAHIADEHLQDLDRAATFYTRALSMGAPETVMVALSEMYERAGRYEDLAALLAEQVEATPTADQKRDLLLRLASVQAEWLQDAAAARDSYLRVLETEEHPTALAYLVGCARDVGDDVRQADYLARLQAVTTDDKARAELLLELATLQELDLEQPNAAIDTLMTLLADVDPRHAEGIERLHELGDAQEHAPGLAMALERRLAMDREGQRAGQWAERLADLYEGPLQDQDGAIRALTTWATIDADALRPHRRLRPLLEARTPTPALVATLDALGRLEEDAEARVQAQLAAADAAAAVGDNDGAWGRLAPLVEMGRAEAMVALAQVCQAADWTDRLANLHVELAQRAGDVAMQKTHWLAAATLLDRELGRSEQALEAALRGFALDMNDREVLAEVDELAVKARAFERLAKVYDRIIQASPDTNTKVGLLQRHADLLEMRAKRRSEALDQVLRACVLSPDSETLLARAERLAAAVDRGEDMLMVYDRRREQTQVGREQVELALRAARLCDGVLQDRGRAEAYLKHALAATETNPELATLVFTAAAQLDERRPELGTDAARRAVVRAHRELAERASPGFAERLILAAAALLREHFESEREAFDALRHGLSLLPTNARVYADLLAAAKVLRRLDTLDAHLAKLIDETIDSQGTVALLGHRGALLEKALKRPQEASQVYSKLLQLRPNDHDVADRLRTSLKRARRYQDLLVEISKQVRQADTDARRLTLLREAAITWERGLRNRFEAREAWEKVLAAAPGDGEALAALERLQSRKSAPAVEDLFRDDPDTADEEGDAEDEVFDDPFPELQDDEEEDDENWPAEADAVGPSLSDARQAPAVEDAFDAEPPSAATGGAPKAEEADAQEDEPDEPDFDLDDLDAALAGADAHHGGEPPDDALDLGGLVATSGGPRASEGPSIPPPVPAAASSRAPGPRKSGHVSMPPPVPPDASRPPAASGAPGPKGEARDPSIPPPIPKR